jgi:ABC-type ATPase involved in cell division
MTRIVEDVLVITGITRFKGLMSGILSSGEQKRIILAIALVQDTPVLLRDELTCVDQDYGGSAPVATVKYGIFNIKELLIIFSIFAQN